MSEFDSTKLEAAIGKAVLESGATFEDAAETLETLAQKYTDLAMNDGTDDLD